MTPLQKWVLHVSLILVAASGVVHGAVKYFGAALARTAPSLFVAPDDPFSAVRHPLQPWSLDVHVLAGPALVFAAGWIFKDHILNRRSANGSGSRSGRLGVLLLFPMIATGYLVQTVTREAWALPVLVLHVGGGLVFVAAYLVHAMTGFRRRDAGSADGALRIGS